MPHYTIGSVLGTEDIVVKEKQSSLFLIVYILVGERDTKKFKRKISGSGKCLKK